MQANYGYSACRVPCKRRDFLMGMVFIVEGDFFPVLLISPSLRFKEFVDRVIASSKLCSWRDTRWFPECWLNWPPLVITSGWAGACWCLPCHYGEVTGAIPASVWLNTTFGDLHLKITLVSLLMGWGGFCRVASEPGNLSALVRHYVDSCGELTCSRPERRVIVDPLGGQKSDGAPVLCVECF